MKSYASDKKLLQNSTQKVYSMIYGLCSAGVRDKLEAMKNDIDLLDYGNPIGLLMNIKTIITNFQTTKQNPYEIHD